MNESLDTQTVQAPPTESLLTRDELMVKLPYFVQTIDATLADGSLMDDSANLLGEFRVWFASCKAALDLPSPDLSVLRERLEAKILEAEDNKAAAIKDGLNPWSDTARAWHWSALAYKAALALLDDVKAGEERSFDEALASPEAKTALESMAKEAVAEHRAKKAIAASFSLLENPTPGMVVEGEGFRWVAEDGADYYLDGPYFRNDLTGEKSGVVGGWYIMPTLRALVKYGAATVRLPQQEEGE